MNIHRLANTTPLLFLALACASAHPDPPGALAGRCFRLNVSGWVPEPNASPFVPELSLDSLLIHFSPRRYVPQTPSTDRLGFHSSALVWQRLSGDSVHVSPAVYFNQEGWSLRVIVEGGELHGAALYFHDQAGTHRARATGNRVECEGTGLTAEYR